MATRYPNQQAHPTQSYPLQGQTPSYEYNPDLDQPWYNCQPQPVTSASVVAVATAQPTVAITTSVPPPEKDYTILAVGALVFSLLTMITCGVFIVCLPCTVPGLILAIVAMQSRGSSQKTSAGLSIGVNATVIVCFMVLVFFAMIPLLLALVA